jgi:hypothetical protein
MGRPKGAGGPTEDLFWEKVDRRGLDECWPWLASVRGSSVKHGQFWVPAGALGNERGWNAQAHNVAFRLLQGHWPVTQGLHGCDNGICCNALNLEHVHEGTQKQNVAEMFERGRARPTGRVPLTPAQQMALFEEFQAANMTQGAFAQAHGLSVRTIERVLHNARSG